MKSKVSVRSQNHTEELPSDHSRIIVGLPLKDFMNLNLNQPIPVLTGLPVTLPRDGAIEIELEQSVLVFRVSKAVQERIEELVEKERNSQLTSDEAQELEQYEEIDDYLSFLNRLTRNLSQSQNQKEILAS
jgi:uncharacterized protein YnzC (UPF0291/DUF896 family)